MLFNNKSKCSKLSFVVIALIMTGAAAWSRSFGDGINTVIYACPITEAFLKPMLAYSSVLIPLDMLITSAAIYYFSKWRKSP